MEIFRSIDGIAAGRPSSVALGFFDGLHLGHTELISGSIAFAMEYGLSADIFTFREHPKNIMSGMLAVPRLLPESDKLEIFEALGADRVFDFDFADSFHTMAPEDFARSLLKDAFGAEAVFCGFNFRFGANAAGDTGALGAYGKEFGFEAYVIDPVYADGELVSSSAIRRHVNRGDVARAGLMLGRDYSLRGLVEYGNKLGREFGFPTANIFPDPEMTLPARGVYVTETAFDGAVFPSISNVGVNPTVADGNAVRLETHILDAAPELYKKEITVFFKEKLREERRFEDKDALIRQIAADTETAREYFRR